MAMANNQPAGRLKKTDLRLGFTKQFTSLGSRQHLSEDELSCRLLLTLFGMGTNIGLKPLAIDESGVSYKGLLYTGRRYLHSDSLRQTTPHLCAVLAVTALWQQCQMGRRQW